MWQSLCLWSKSYFKWQTSGVPQSKMQFFHLGCLRLKRMLNNSKTTWQFPACRKSKFQPTTCISSSSEIESENEVAFVKKTVGSINKTSVFANLTSTDFDIINDPNGWLDCSIIQQAQVLLQQHNPLIDGLQWPTLGRVRNFDIASGEFIQILHTGTDHWLCISSIGCSPGVVHLFDSFYNDVILTEVEEQTQDLLGGKQVHLVYVPVRQQTNGSDCGVFAIAFATCLAFGENPLMWHLMYLKCDHIWQHALNTNTFLFFHTSRQYQSFGDSRKCPSNLHPSYRIYMKNYNHSPHPLEFPIPSRRVGRGCMDTILLFSGTKHIIFFVTVWCTQVA